MRARVWIRGPGALLASVLVHAAGLGTGAILLSRTLSAAEPSHAAPRTIEVTLAGSTLDLPPMSGAGLTQRADPRARPDPEPVAAGGGDHEPRPDMPRAGHGGTDVSARALNLADSDDGVTLDRDPMNRLDRSQVQRLRTARERVTRDDRRATPHPMELSFLATGHGRTAARRPEARYDPSRGVLSGGLPAERGSILGGDELLEDGRGAEPDPGGAHNGNADRASAAGIPGGAVGRDYRRSASVMLARPWVPRARAAVPAPTRGRPNDNVDSSQEVASAVRSLIHASTAGGRSGAGPGGESGPGPAGSGGVHGPGSRTTPAGYGPGALRDPGADPRATGYFRAIQRKVGPYWRHAFPDWAVGEGRGGVAVVGFTIVGDGGVGKIHLVRSSGIAEFDRNVMAALARAAPFGPLPAVLGHGPLELRIAFDATNPAVGREGPGNGRRR